MAAADTHVIDQVPGCVHYYPDLTAESKQPSRETLLISANVGHFATLQAGNTRTDHITYLKSVRFSPVRFNSGGKQNSFVRSISRLHRGARGRPEVTKSVPLYLLASAQYYSREFTLEWKCQRVTQIFTKSHQTFRSIASIAVCLALTAGPVV